MTVALVAATVMIILVLVGFVGLIVQRNFQVRRYTTARPLILPRNRPSMRNRECAQPEPPRA